MKPVERSELLDLGAYEQIRDQFRKRVIEEKRRRRVALGDNMTVIFENHDTVLLQIQEMLRTERITQEKGILHELETYNALVPGDSEVSATVFIEYTDKAERDRMLVKLAGVEDTLYLKAAGERAKPVSEMRGDRTDRTTAVHYVKFELGQAARAAIAGKQGPVKLGVEHPEYRAEVELSAETIESLADDLA